MAKANMNTRSKRMRELARKDKREIKDEKRAKKKADARAAKGGADATPSTPAAANPLAAPNVRSLAAAAFIRRMNKTP